MNIDPIIAVGEVTDLPSLIDFIGVLSHDWNACAEKETSKLSNPYESMYGWENWTVGMFLDAMKSWAEDAKAIKQGDNPYRMFAHMLLAGKMYE